MEKTNTSSVTYRLLRMYGQKHAMEKQVKEMELQIAGLQSFVNGVEWADAEHEKKREAEDRRLAEADKATAEAAMENEGGTTYPPDYCQEDVDYLD